MLQVTYEVERVKIEAEGGCRRDGAGTLLELCCRPLNLSRLPH